MKLSEYFRTTKMTASNKALVALAMLDGLSSITCLSDHSKISVKQIKQYPLKIMIDNGVVTLLPTGSYVFADHIEVDESEARSVIAERLVRFAK